MPLNDTKLLSKTIETLYNEAQEEEIYQDDITEEYVGNQIKPSFWEGELDISCEHGESANDTFLQLDGWSKGVAFVNGFNLGRYWPVMGPQVI